MHSDERTRNDSEIENGRCGSSLAFLARCFDHCHWAGARAGLRRKIYKGRTLSILIPFAPGGSYDNYARLTADPTPGEEVQQISNQILSTPPDIVQLAIDVSK
jgi:hypothetical protein